MKERPILFSGPMVRAILDGRKSQARRVMKPQPDKGLLVGCYTTDGDPQATEWVLADEDGDPIDAEPIKCPYGGPGDRLWVRETWGIFTRSNSDKLMCVWYKTSGLNSPVTNVPLERRFPEIDDGLKWHPSIFMPKKYTRIWLEITEVRAERVQEISIDDGWNEGVSMPYERGDGPWDDPGAKERFPVLWDTINAKRGYSWESNPWVFAISFKKVD